MPKGLSRVFSHLLQLIVRGLMPFTDNRGGGKVALYLPKGQVYRVSDYCGNLHFNVDTTYPIEGTIWLSGVYDIRTTRFLQRFLQPGDIVLDVGANCGALTLVAAQQVNPGKVYAFEPAPDIRSRLQANLALNPALQSQVEVVSAALGSTQRQLFYQADRGCQGNGRLAETSGLPVEVMPLDDWLEQTAIARIDLIKIDTEGMEFDILQGAQRAIAQYHPTIHFETLPAFFATTPYTIQTLYEFLAGFGYQIRNPEPPYAPVPFTGPYPPNSAAIHPSRLKQLQISF
jgi:FkbM family methyltransferase